ncbi:MAG: TIGR02281 family clan AA aspartic protease [Elusimicrobia bacterium]|nr:TIGR02281 family clan AA aspartic protease [Elusimicrobiota bacterium]
MRRAGFWLSTVALLAAAAAVRADTVELTNGNRIEGVIVSQNASEIVVDIGYGTVSLRRTEIAGIHRTSKKRRKAVERELSRRRFESGQQVPQGAEKLDGLMREVLAQREKAFDAKNRRAELDAEIKRIEAEAPELRRRYNELSRQIDQTDPRASEYNTLVAQANQTGHRMSAGMTRAEEALEESRAAGAEIDRYSEGYHRLQEYLRGAGAALAAAGRTGPDADYYAWVERESRQMQKDFSEEAVASEDKRGGSVVVTAVVNGRSLRLLVDTGASFTTLYGASAGAFGVDAKDELGSVFTVVADGRKVKGERVRLSSVKVGASEVAGSTAVLLPRTRQEFDGLLGMSFLSRFVFHVDPAAGKLVLERLK